MTSAVTTLLAGSASRECQVPAPSVLLKTPWPPGVPCTPPPGTCITCVEDRWALWVDGEGVDIVDGQTLTSRTPRLATVGALKDVIPIRPRVESGRSLGIDGQGHNRGIGEAYAPPGLSAVSTLKDSSSPRWPVREKAYIERGRRRW